VNPLVTACWAGKGLIRRPFPCTPSWLTNRNAPTRHRETWKGRSPRIGGFVSSRLIVQLENAKHAQIAGRSEEYDIAIIGNRIARIGHGLKAAHARVLVEAEGYIVKLAGLAEGAPANVAVLDAGRTVMTVSNGRIVTDDEGLSIPDVSRAGPYSNFK